MSESWGFGKEEVAQIRKKIIKDFEPGGQYYTDRVQGLLRTLGADIKKAVKERILADMAQHMTKELQDLLRSKTLKEEVEKGITKIILDRVDDIFKEHDEYY